VEPVKIQLRESNFLSSDPHNSASPLFNISSA